MTNIDSSSQQGPTGEHQHAQEGQLTPVSVGAQWLLNEAAGDHKLHELIAAREAAIDDYIFSGKGRDTREWYELNVAKSRVRDRKAEIGVDPLVAPEIQYGVTEDGDVYTVPPETPKPDK